MLKTKGEIREALAIIRREHARLLKDGEEDETLAGMGTMLQWVLDEEPGHLTMERFMSGVKDVEWKFRLPIPDCLAWILPVSWRHARCPTCNGIGRITATRCNEIRAERAS